VKYRDLGGTGIVKVRYRGIPWYGKYRPSLSEGRVRRERDNDV